MRAAYERAVRQSKSFQQFGHAARCLASLHDAFLGIGQSEVRRARRRFLPSRLRRRLGHLVSDQVGPPSPYLVTAGVTKSTDSPPQVPGEPETIRVNLLEEHLGGQPPGDLFGLLAGDSRYDL